MKSITVIVLSITLMVLTELSSCSAVNVDVNVMRDLKQGRILNLPSVCNIKMGESYNTNKKAFKLIHLIGMQCFYKMSNYDKMIQIEEADPSTQEYSNLPFVGAIFEIKYESTGQSGFTQDPNLAVIYCTSTPEEDPVRAVPFIFNLIKNKFFAII